MTWFAWGGNVSRLRWLARPTAQGGRLERNCISILLMLVSFRMSPNVSKVVIHTQVWHVATLRWSWLGMVRSMTDKLQQLAKDSEFGGEVNSISFHFHSDSHGLSVLLHRRWECSQTKGKNRLHVSAWQYDTIRAPTRLLLLLKMNQSHTHGSRHLKRPTGFRCSTRLHTTWLSNTIHDWTSQRFDVDSSQSFVELRVSIYERY